MRGKSWLQDHLENFVRPVLGFIPTESLTYFSAEEMAVIKNMWKSAKQASKGKLLVLPGRDVQVFEILARREGFPTLFLPNCSRGTVSNMEVPDNSFIFDTGFIGSIPKKLGVTDFLMASHSHQVHWLETSSNYDNKQVFPRLSLSRHLALKIESTPKYWNTARMLDGKIQQSYSPLEEFKRAAELTIAIYKDSSPSFVNQRQPLGQWRFGAIWKTKS